MWLFCTNQDDYPTDSEHMFTALRSFKASHWLFLIFGVIVNISRSTTFQFLKIYSPGTPDLVFSVLFSFFNHLLNVADHGRIFSRQLSILLHFAPCFNVTDSLQVHRVCAYVSALWCATRCGFFLCVLDWVQSQPRSDAHIINSANKSCVLCDQPSRGKRTFFEPLARA